MPELQFSLAPSAHSLPGILEKIKGPSNPGQQRITNVLDILYEVFVLLLFYAHPGWNLF